MKVKNNNSHINFTSNIRVVNLREFSKEIATISSQNVAKKPWTAKEIIKASEAYTTGICECTAGGITNGTDVVMFHISRGPENDDFSVIERTLLKKLNILSPEARVGLAVLKGLASVFFPCDVISENIHNLKGAKRPPLKGFLLGSHWLDGLSTRVFHNLESFMEKYNIPFSKFDGQRLTNNTNISYKAAKDEWLISNEYFSKLLDDPRPRAGFNEHDYRSYLE